MVYLTMWDEASGHLKMYRRRNEIHRTKTGSISALTATAAIMTDSGMKDGKAILSWSN